jgi:acyl-CoA synthetase (NDP forming)
MAHLGFQQDEVEARIRKITEWQGSAFTDLLERHEKPIVGYTWRDLDEPTIKTFVSRGIPVFSEVERAARAISAMTRYSEYRKKMTPLAGTRS